MKPLLAVIDYGMGNLRSVVRAWEHVGAAVKLVSNPDEAKDVDALVFPGQGAIVDAMRLLQKTGFSDFIRDWIAGEKPFFGICLGLQALFEHSEEGDTKALGVFKGNVRRFNVQVPLKVPHMGWNRVKQSQHPLWKGIEDNAYFYFVHSFCAQVSDEHTVGVCKYGVPFSAVMAKDNIFAVQFHPEKSGKSGERILQNFVSQYRT